MNRLELIIRFMPLVGMGWKEEAPCTDVREDIAARLDEEAATDFTKACTDSSTVHILYTGTVYVTDSENNTKLILSDKLLASDIHDNILSVDSSKLEKARSEILSEQKK